MTYRFDFPAANSMTASNAAKWYLAMIPLIPKIKIDDASGDSDLELLVDEFKSCWRMKCRLRLAAALAMYDPELVDEFFAKLPLRPAAEYLGAAFARTGSNKAFDLAMVELLDVSEAENLAFPGALEEAIGMECRASDGVYVMTADGWTKQE